MCRSWSGNRLYKEFAFYLWWCRLFKRSWNLQRRFPSLSERLPLQRWHLCHPGGNSRISEGTSSESGCSDHGSTACWDGDPEYHQSSVSDRNQDFPYRIRSQWRRYHGIRPSPCPGTGCRIIRCKSSDDRRMCRYFQCTCRTDVRRSCYGNPRAQLDHEFPGWVHRIQNLCRDVSGQLYTLSWHLRYFKIRCSECHPRIPGI